MAKLLQFKPVAISSLINVYGDWIICLHLHQAEPALVSGTLSVLVVHCGRSGCISAEKRVIISTESLLLRNYKV